MHDDEFAHGDEYVHDNMDKEMKDAEDVETRKDDEEITDAEKTYAKKTEVTQGDLEQAGKLPLTSSSLSVSSGFGNQFLNLSSDASLIGTTKESADTKINPLLDIQIQQEAPQIQSPNLLKVPVLVILEQTTPTPSLVLPTETPVSTVPLPLPTVSTILFVQQQTTPIPTPPITTIALSTTTMRQKHTEELIQPSSQKDVSKIIKIKQEHAAKEKMPKFSATPYDQAADALYDALILSPIQDEDDLFRVIPDLRKRDREEDEDPYAGSNQGKSKRSLGKNSEPLKTSSTSKETFKGDTPPKYSKTSKSASAEETVKEATHEVTMGEEEPVQENVNDADQPQEVATPRKEKLDWFKQPPRPPTPDLEWNKCQVVDDQPEQTDMPKRKWSYSDKRRSGIMVDLIEKQMLERQVPWNLERFVGARELEMDYRLMQTTTKTELTLEQTQQGVSDEVLVTRTASAAAKPYQGDSYELITCSIYTE
ncbi:hypothetical protein Tco_0904092 [Tanacetum coccineum]